MTKNPGSSCNEGSGHHLHQVTLPVMLASQETFFKLPGIHLSEQGFTPRGCFIPEEFIDQDRRSPSG
jgi:hypothetical protein